MDGPGTSAGEVPGVAGVSPVRRFFAVAYLSHGIPISTMSAWMGHSEIDLTRESTGPEPRLRAEPIAQVASRAPGLRVVT